MLYAATKTFVHRRRAPAHRERNLSENQAKPRFCLGEAQKYMDVFFGHQVWLGTSSAALTLARRPALPNGLATYLTAPACKDSLAWPLAG